MGKDRSFGKVTANLNGFNIRMQVENKRNTGKFGIYAGKRLVQEVNSTEEAIQTICQPDFVDNWRKKKFSKRKK